MWLCTVDFFSENIFNDTFDNYIHCMLLITMNWKDEYDGMKV